MAVNLTRRLLERGERVLCVDDLSRGRRELVVEFDAAPRFSFRQGDCSNARNLGDLLDSFGLPIDQVWHLAANSDIPAGVEDLTIDLERTFLTTVGVLQTIRRRGIRRLHFASSSAIYGDLGDTEITETIGPLEPISNYGAMKLASEAQIRAAVESFLPQADIFRFPNVIGVPATHGVILDFIHKLRATPNRLDVLGDGSQQKAYLHVDDLVDAMLHVSAMEGRFNVFNIGPLDDGITVKEIAETVRDHVAPTAEIAFGAGSRGWVGDVPRFRYSTRKLNRSGWEPRLGSRAAVIRAIQEISAQESIV